MQVGSVQRPGVRIDALHAVRRAAVGSACLIAESLQLEQAAVWLLRGVGAVEMRPKNGRMGWVR